MKNYVTFESPIGLLYLISEKNFLIAIQFKKTSEMGELNENDVLKKTKKQLAEFFSGKRKSFDLMLSHEGTAFQKKAWLNLQKIPYGQTRSYQEQAVACGTEKAVRAIGTANGKNPLPIVIPCHRVIRSDGSLGGYAGGLRIKKYLLDLEAN